MKPFIYVLQSELRTRPTLRILAAAAGRHGIPLPEYLDNLERGLLWCSGCKAWHREDQFGLKRSGRSGRDACCLTWRRAYGRERYVPIQESDRMPMPRMLPEDRFWRYVKKLPSGCWEWQGARGRQGYGSLRLPVAEIRRIYVPYLFPCRKIAEQFHLIARETPAFRHGEG